MILDMTCKCGMRTPKHWVSFFYPLHLLIFVAKIILELMITGWNVDSNKGRLIADPASFSQE